MLQVELNVEIKLTIRKKLNMKIKTEIIYVLKQNLEIKLNPLN